ncbi:MAG: SAM-dependent methyltransferase [Leptolyngbya sp.]|nr:MAG: SAM-dependent methyltransferase [Leptolyngbya sp.]
MKRCLRCKTKFDGLKWSCPQCGYQPSRVGNHLSFAPNLAENGDTYEADFFAQLFELEAKNFWFRSRNQLLIWILKSTFASAQSFLEVGCGTGFVLSEVERSLPHLTSVGAELFATGLNFASHRLSKAELLQMDARFIPYDDQFDVVGAFDVLEHIPEDTVVLSEMYRSITPGGGLILTVPQHPWLWSHADTYAHHVRRYTATELRLKVENAGFQIIRMTSFMSFLLPLMFLSRLRQRQSKAEYDPIAELKISGWLNTAFEIVLNLERMIIRSGLSLPFGGSLLLVAKKL